MAETEHGVEYRELEDRINDESTPAERKEAAGRRRLHLLYKYGRKFQGEPSLAF